MRYRLGRHNDRILYRQQGDDPSKGDDMVAVFFDAIDALATVQLLNGEPATINSELTVDPPLLVRCKFNREPHPVDDECQDIYESPARPVGSVSRACAAVSWPSDEAVRAGRFGPCILVEHQTHRGHAEVYTLHRDEHGNEWTSASPVGGSVSVPPPVERHPESYCHRCGGPNIIWAAPSPLWNAVMRGGSIDGADEYDGIVCPTCFGVLAEERGIAQLWRLDAERVAVELETVTPSGRLWDSISWCWSEPPERSVTQRLTPTTPAWRDAFQAAREAAHRRATRLGLLASDSVLREAFNVAWAAGVAEGRRLEREDRDNDAMEAMTRE